MPISQSFILYIGPASIVFAKSEYAPVTCEERLKSLEPPEPKTIYGYELLLDRDLSKFNEEVLPITEIQKKGSEVPFATVFKDLNWQRLAYAPGWHSTYWRWSYVPLIAAGNTRWV